MHYTGWNCNYKQGNPLARIHPAIPQLNPTDEATAQCSTDAQSSGSPFKNENLQEKQLKSDSWRHLAGNPILFLSSNFLRQNLHFKKKKDEATPHSSKTPLSNKYSILPSSNTHSNRKNLILNFRISDNFSQIPHLPLDFSWEFSFGF